MIFFHETAVSGLLLSSRFQFGELAATRNASLIARISMAASLIGIRSRGCCFEQDTPSPVTETKQHSILLLAMAELAASTSIASSCSQIAGSAISTTLLGRAASANLCRSKESLNMSSVGLLPVNISSNKMPRL